jgi:hypothetical protein
MSGKGHLMDWAAVPWCLSHRRVHQSLQRDIGRPQGFRSNQTPLGIRCYVYYGRAAT